MPHFHSALLAIVLLFSTYSLQVQAQYKKVFAHFIVGNSAAFQQTDWESDIQAAKAAGLDGFALNIGNDDYTGQQLSNAFSAAEAIGNFQMFISFDYGAYPDWTTAQVQQITNQYGVSSAYFQYWGKPLVSTFEGPDATATDWNAIGSEFSLLPSWTSLGPAFSSRLGQVVGALAWAAWPTYPDSINTANDVFWSNMLQGKSYMMAVSPWFYADCYGKNWLWSGDDLWHERWQQVIEYQPDFVEVLTWNDFGESHYIGPLRPSGFPTGSERYATDMPHDAWREMLPYYINAYKAGNATKVNHAHDDEKLVYYHRINPSTAGSTGGTTANTPTQGQTPAAPQLASQDAIFVDVLVKEPSNVAIRIGGNPATTLQASVAGINHFSVPFNGQTGPVKYTVTRGGQTILSTIGATITSDCTDGLVNWNAIVGSSNATLTS
ncbi:MAG: hypothetical protein MMC33_007372 [Icmadophila ericetorum]|nr:hypothetical protein [Icmadophila ericetorum]